MIYEVRWTSHFKNDYKAMVRRGADMRLLHEVIDLLRQGLPLPERCRNHALSGSYSNHRECHIKPDWLLIYYISDKVLVLALTRTGTHSDLFK
jgi:mRNA interferase YafQ